MEVKTGRRYKIKPETYKQIYDEFEKGITQRELSEKYECSISTIYKIIREIREKRSVG